MRKKKYNVGIVTQNRKHNVHVQLGFIVAGVRNNLESPQSLFLQGENVMHFNRGGKKTNKKNKTYLTIPLLLISPRSQSWGKKGASVAVNPHISYCNNVLSSGFWCLTVVMKTYLGV